MPETLKTNAKVAVAPCKQLHVAVNWQFTPQWNTQLDVFSFKDRPRAAGDTRDQIKDYNWINLSLNSIYIIKDFDVQIAIRNLADTDAREPASTFIPNDYPLAGRSVYLG